MGCYAETEISSLLTCTIYIHATCYCLTVRCSGDLKLCNFITSISVSLLYIYKSKYVQLYLLFKLCKCVWVLVLWFLSPTTELLTTNSDVVWGLKPLYTNATVLIQFKWQRSISYKCWFCSLNIHTSCLMPNIDRNALPVDWQGIAVRMVMLWLHWLWQFEAICSVYGLRSIKVGYVGVASVMDLALSFALPLLL
jgi:hypothetical protein